MGLPGGIAGSPVSLHLLFTMARQRREGKESKVKGTPAWTVVKTQSEAGHESRCEDGLRPEKQGEDVASKDRRESFPSSCPEEADLS